jgi:trimeric autotransporter adhesin
MALPVTVPNTFAGATASIPLSQLDANFNSLSNAINGIANGVETLANVQVTGGTINNVSSTNLSVSNVTVTSGTIANVTINDVVLSNNNRELVTVQASAAASTVDFNVLTSQVLFYTANATADWTLNVRGDGSTALNDIMEDNQSVTITFFATQGSTGYYANVFTIDSSSVTPLWQGGSAPSAGNADSVDVYVLNITKTANATYTILGSQTQFA